MRMRSYGAPILLVLPLLFGSVAARAASCKTESMMTAAERDSLAQSVRALAAQVQTGDTAGLRSNTIPAVAANFDGIAASVAALHPDVEHASFTIYDLYALDASDQAAGAAQTDFYCGSPVVVLNFTGLPPGKYGLAILHATGVPKPQQISLILSETSENHWMLAGFFDKPMMEAGHDGLWYWTQARQYAQKKMNWDAWLYYQTAALLLNPADFVASPNLGKLQQEAEHVRPADLPGAQPAAVSAAGSSFAVTAITPTAEFGPLDLEVDYTPDASQSAQLRDPVAARQQVLALMQALVAQHPELRDAFHGIWVRANQGNASVYALDLPMDQISGSSPASAH